MKLVWASLTSLEDEFSAYAEGLRSHLEEVSRDDTEIEFMGSPRGVAGNYRTFKLLDEAELIKDYVRLRHRDDVDGVAIGSAFDSGMRPARETLTKPVLGYTETALLVAHMLADRFAIIAGTDKFVPIFQENVDIYGLEDRVSGIYSPSSNSRYLEILAGAYDDEDLRAQLVEELDPLVERAVDDGAELVIPGGGAIPTLLRMEGVDELHGVPVMDATTVLVRMTETMATLYDLGAVETSKKRLYRSPPEDFLEELESVYEL